MSNRNSLILWRVLACALVPVGIWCCGGDHAPMTPAPQPVLTCGSVTNCINWADAGRCADKANAKCLNAPDGSAGASAKECVYPLAIKTTGCTCIEGSSRICKLNDAGVMGVRMCNVRPDDGGTQWEDCVGLNDGGTP